MRLYHFNWAAGNTSQSGIPETFVTGSIASDIMPADIVVAVATPRGEADLDPYGNVNIFVPSRTVTGGEVSVTFGKSAAIDNTTDSIDSIIFSAR